MTTRLLLDEMFTAVIAAELRAKGHDVTALQGDPAGMGLPDPAVLARATAEGRALVTRNLKDFVALDAAARAAGNAHPGLVFVSTKTFPEDRGATAALVRSLDHLLVTLTLADGETVFLRRMPGS
jgi:predicted nuclease of predicted toxin-antitoxin system